MDEPGPSQDKVWKLKAANSTRCYQLGIKSLGFDQSGHIDQIFLKCAEFDGTEDDMVSEDLPSVDSEPEDQESESDDEGDTHTVDDDDVNDIDPFSDDSDSDSD